MLGVEFTVAHNFQYLFLIFTISNNTNSLVLLTVPVDVHKAWLAHLESSVHFHYQFRPQILLMAIAQLSTNICDVCSHNNWDNGNSHFESHDCMEDQPTETIQNNKPQYRENNKAEKVDWECGNLILY